MISKYFQFSFIFILILFTVYQAPGSQVFSVPQGRWKEKKGSAEIIVAPSHIQFRQSSEAEFEIIPYACTAQIRNEYWIQYTENKNILNSNRALLIFNRFSIDLILYYDDGKIKTFEFKK